MSAVGHALVHSRYPLWLVGLLTAGIMLAPTAVRADEQAVRDGVFITVRYPLDRVGFWTTTRR